MSVMLSNDATLESPARGADTEKVETGLEGHAIDLRGKCYCLDLKLIFFCLV